MNDPYIILGVEPTASDEEVKRAYRELVKKYHPDHFQNNPLADLAEEKMKEVNEAYDAVIRMRTEGGYRNSASTQGNNYAGGSSDPVFAQVRNLINQWNLEEAGRILQNTRVRNAEWYFLMGSVSYQKGWMEDARQYFWTACNMEPSNLEYREAKNQLEAQARRGFGSYRGGGMGTGDLCAALACLSCFCDGCQ